MWLSGLRQGGVSFWLRFWGAFKHSFVDGIGSLGWAPARQRRPGPDLQWISIKKSIRNWPHGRRSRPGPDLERISKRNILESGRQAAEAGNGLLGRLISVLGASRGRDEARWIGRAESSTGVTDWSPGGKQKRSRVGRGEPNPRQGSLV